MDPSPLDIGPLILGSLIGTLGLLGLVISLLGRRRVDPLLASFGAFTLLWGVRLFFSTPLVGAFGVSRLPAAWVSGTITYLINVPAWFFFWQLVGRGWRSTIYWGVWVMTAFAAVGIVSDLVQRRPWTLDTPNSLLVIAGIAALGATLWGSRTRMTPDLKLLAGGLTAFGLLALNDNLVGLASPKRATRMARCSARIACNPFSAARDNPARRPSATPYWTSSAAGAAPMRISLWRTTSRWWSWTTGLTL